MKRAESLSAADQHAPAEQCSTCRRPIRRCRVLTEVTLYLDALPHHQGSYVFQGQGRAAVEDPHGGGPKFRRHRCEIQHIFGPE